VLTGTKHRSSTFLHTWQTLGRGRRERGTERDGKTGLRLCWQVQLPRRSRPAEAQTRARTNLRQGEGRARSTGQPRCGTGIATHGSQSCIKLRQTLWGQSSWQMQMQMPRRCRAAGARTRARPVNCRSWVPLAPLEHPEAPSAPHHATQMQVPRPRASSTGPMRLLWVPKPKAEHEHPLFWPRFAFPCSRPQRSKWRRQSFKFQTIAHSLWRSLNRQGKACPRIFKLPGRL